MTGKHHATACDVCGEWQHRKCQTGMMLQVYFRFAITCALFKSINIALVSQTNRYIGSTGENKLLYSRMVSRLA